MILIFLLSLRYLSFVSANRKGNRMMTWASFDRIIDWLWHEFWQVTARWKASGKVWWDWIDKFTSLSLGCHINMPVMSQLSSALFSPLPILGQNSDRESWFALILNISFFFLRIMFLSILFFTPLWIFQYNYF